MACLQRRRPELPAVETLRRVWIQQFFVEEGHCRWRSNEQIPPPSLIIASPYDLDARLGVKRNHGWIGYKVHLTESCDDDQPHLIVHTETTAASTPDWGMAEPIHRALAQQDCLPNRHVVDGGYVDADAIVTSRSKYDVELFGPVPLENSWQAKAEHGFDLSHFQIDWQSQTVTCPTRQRSRSWTHTKDRFGQEVIYAKFAPADCLALPKPWAVYTGPISWLDVSSSGTLSGAAVGTRAAEHRSVQSSLRHPCRHRKHYRAGRARQRSASGTLLWVTKNETPARDHGHKTDSKTDSHKRF